MAIYAIGDIQGCYQSFLRLLDAIHFNPAHDTLWLVGDIVNRGTGSLEMLRWAHQHRDTVRMVLGNHDLHAICVAEGIAKPHRSDTLTALLQAPDAQDLLAWLRHQPLLFAHAEFLMVHAGILPQWSATQAQQLANEVEQALQAHDYRDFLIEMYGNHPAVWHESLSGNDRLRVITNVFTRMRICTHEGALQMQFKGEPADIPAGCLPWFDLPHRQTARYTIVCGHWSALGLRITPHLIALDTGCLWGGVLTAVRLEDKAVVQVPCDVGDRSASIALSD